MSIATFGPVVFEVSSSRVRTFKTLKRHGKAVFARHDVIGGKPLLQFTGLDLEEISFTIRLDVSFGLNPVREINALRAMRDAGKEHPLLVGGENFGSFVLEGFDEDWQKTDQKGRLLVAEVSLSLVEYGTTAGKNKLKPAASLSSISEKITASLQTVVKPAALPLPLPVPAALKKLPAFVQAVAAQAARLQAAMQRLPVLIQSVFNKLPALPPAALQAALLKLPAALQAAVQKLPAALQPATLLNNIQGFQAELQGYVQQAGDLQGLVQGLPIAMQAEALFKNLQKLPVGVLAPLQNLPAALQPTQLQEALQRLPAVAQQLDDVRGRLQSLPVEVDRYAALARPDIGRILRNV